MQGVTGERWQELCKQLAAERDPEINRELVKELNQILDEETDRLREKEKAKSKSGSVGVIFSTPPLPVCPSGLAGT
jgi:hypothetical protein